MDPKVKLEEEHLQQASSPKEELSTASEGPEEGTDADTKKQKK